MDVTADDAISPPLAFSGQRLDWRDLPRHVRSRIAELAGAPVSAEIGATTGFSPGFAAVLEFSKVWEPLKPVYDWYSFRVLPRLGQFAAGDGESYRYLAESIRMHPDREALKALMEASGFDSVAIHNLAAGVVALHLGYRY